MRARAESSNGFASSPPYEDGVSAWRLMEKYDDAIDAFKKALMLDDKSSTVLFDLGNLMYLKGE